MKIRSMILLVATSFLLISCGNNKAATNETQSADNSSTEKKEEPVSVAAASGEGIVGTWKLRLEVFDDNGNRIPDEAEMKKGYSNNYNFQFNADGTCRIQQMFTGRYEKKTENGRDMLYVYRKKVEGEEDKDPLPDIFQITSVKKDELVLQIIMAGEPSSFWFFKRI
jgi:hypothetical protein